ncbi:MAG: Ig-like domain-containing protein [Gaiellaceae bacterium]
MAAAGTLSSLTLGRSMWGAAASAAYYAYCPNGSASAVYYAYCPPAITTLTTNPQPVVGPTGSEFRDEATLSGGSDPAGTITFRFYGPDDPLCQNPPAFTSVVVVDHGNGTYTSGGFTPSHSQFGSYEWTAHYSGDGDNAPSSSPCGLEPVVVTRIPAHFKAYEVDQATPLHADELVLLTDQFGTEQVHVAGARLLLTPVEKRRQNRPVEPILRADEHQTCYVVTGGVNQNRTVRVSNQFVTGATLRVDGPTRLCAPASKSLTGPPTASPVDTQHYKCYSVFETSQRPEEIVDLVDQFGLQRFGVKAATLLCNPVTKQRLNRPAEPAPRPDEHLVCYTLRKLQLFSPRRVFTLDQFISQRVRVKNPLLLCVPSEKLP